MLLWLMIVRFHPGQTGANAASCTSSVFSNSFRSHSFRTLASHFQTSVSSNSFEINPFRTLCQIPGIGYPPPSILLRIHLPGVRSASAEIARFCALTLLLSTLAHFMGGGGYQDFNPRIEDQNEIRIHPPPNPFDPIEGPRNKRA
jgi:hypothetical protein